MLGYICPKCGEPLHTDGKSYLCPKGHCFDVAKEGYVNLLTADKKHSKEPGDNAEMVRARYSFLAEGYYSPLAKELSAILSERGAKAVLDAGCGSGYYTEFVQDFLPGAQVFGVDISKEAVRLGAKHGRARYAVAGVYDLPFADGVFDAVTNVFSPFAFKEYARVLKDNGVLLSVYPAPRHLYELKEKLYGGATFENDKEAESPLFEREDRRRVTSAVEIANGEDLFRLLSMTPYYYTTAKEKIDEVRALDGLLVTLDFWVDVFVRK